MLCPADQALAARDPALRGLSLLLDDDALSGWLTEQLGTPVTARAGYVRYKAGTSCAVGVDVTGPQGSRPGMVEAFSADGADKQVKSLDRAPEGSVLGVDLDLGLLATTATADRDLPALRSLQDDHKRQRLLGRLLGEKVRHASLTTLQHKPHRRWVGLLQPEHGPPVVLRAYPPERMPGATAALTALHGGHPWTPRLLGTDTRHGLAAVEFREGRTLHEQRRDATAAPCPDDFEVAGAALARLHARTDVALGPGPLVDEARAVRAVSRQLAVLMPDRSRDLDLLADKVCARLLSMPDLHQPVHGDFSPDQVVVDPDGHAGLIDLDSARLGDPSVDLASAAATLARDMVLGGVSDATRAQLMWALYEGYTATGRAPDEGRLATHEAAHLLRRAVEPFRLRLCDDWPQASADLVERARRTLADVPATGGRR